MALRDVPYRRYVITFLVAGLAPDVIEALPLALERSTAGLLRGRARATAPARLRHEDQRLDDEELLAAVGHRDLGGRPVEVTVCGDRLVVRLSHLRFDGTTGMAFLHELIDRACGAEPTLDRRPIARYPVLTALKSVRPRSVREFRARRMDGRLHTAAAVPRPSASPTLRTFVIPRDLLAVIKRTRGPWAAQGRATLSTKLCHAVLMTLRAVQRAPGDLRVRVPADLRHLVPRGRVPGNFVCGDAIGTLHGTGWTPQEITRRLSSASGVSGAVSVATAWPRDLAARLVHSLSAPASAVNVSVVPSQPFPRNAFGEGGARLACVSAGDAPSPVFVFVWMVDGAAHVSVYDDTGLFDLSGFEGRLLAALQDAYAPS